MAPFTGLRLILITISLSLAAFMQILDSSIANVSIPYIAGDLAVSNNQGTWVITSFAVGNAIALPLTGFLASRFGQVRIMVLSTLLFTILSWLCGGAVNFEMIVTSRFFQGFVAGPLIPLSQSLLLQTYPTEKRNYALTIFTLVIVVAPIIGPVLGGWLTYDYHWSWIFYINLPVGIASTLITWMLLRDRESKLSKAPTDWIGMFLLFVGIGCLQILLDKGEQYDWFSSPIINSLAVISFVCITFLIVWEIYEKNPIIDMSLFKIRNFRIGTFLASISYMTIFGAIIITPLWLQTQMGYTSLWAGLAVMPMGFCPLILGFFLPKVMQKFKLKYIVMFCFAILSTTFFVFSYCDTDVSFLYIASSRVLLGLGLTFWFAPIVAISMQEVPKEKTTSASGLFHFCRIFSGGAATSLYVYLWDRRAIFHHQRLGETLTSFTTSTGQVNSLLAKENITGNKALELINAATDNQAYMLATNDIFYLAGILAIGMIFFAFFFKKGKPQAEMHTEIAH